MLRFPPILAGSKSHLDQFYWPSAWGFMVFTLHHWTERLVQGFDIFPQSFRKWQIDRWGLAFLPWQQYSGTFQNPAILLFKLCTCTPYTMKFNHSLGRCRLWKQWGRLGSAEVPCPCPSEKPEILHRLILHFGHLTPLVPCSWDMFPQSAQHVWFIPVDSKNVYGNPR